MRDELFDREYQDGREAMNDGIDRALQAIGRFAVTAATAFRNTGRAIHAFEFDAPWQRSAPVKRIKPIKRTRAA